MTTPSPPPPDQSAQLLLLGQIHGIVQGLKDGQAEQNKRFDRLDDRMDGVDARLRTVEQKAAVSGAISGGVVGVGMALLIEGLKNWVKRGTPSP